jgi:acetyl-CoA carboxylase biotin carboxyl carrier protein
MPAAPQRAKGGRKAGDVNAAEVNGDRGTGATITMDLDFLRGLIEAVDQSGIDSLEIHRAGTRIRISKTPPPAAPAANASAPSAQAVPASAPTALNTPAVQGAPAAQGESNPGPAAPAAGAEAASKLVDVKSPMVGTFYRAPAPEAPPYVEVGSVVTKGQTLCILEAMKLMNELESEVDGVVRAVLADNADPIEYGQVLFRIEPSGSR